MKCKIPVQACAILFGMLVTAQLSFGANPVLLVTSSANPFSAYCAEILRAEGLNAFDTIDISGVDAANLAAYDVTVLGEIPLTAAQVSLLTGWVSAGGNLIAMRPDKQLAPLLGISDTASALSNGYIQVNTATGAGAGIVGQTIQFHGGADQYLPNGATTIATLYSTASAPTPYPAVSLRIGIGSGGKAAAFTYDLARSVVYTRQGNPAWAGQARVAQGGPIRAGDMFYGAATFDPQPNWVDLNKVAIPQADEQQRLLANLILFMNQAKKPLPRFWYLPFGKKAAVIMTGDDHAVGGTATRFDDMLASSAPGCSVSNWECVRGTSYVYANGPLTEAQAAGYNAQGFEIAVHVNTNCADYTPSSLEATFATQFSNFGGRYPSLPAPQTNRTHCIAWSDWASSPQVELSHGVRLDTNYYYWPGSWVQNRPGLFTGSGLPMRFAQTDGTLIDVYQATTQMPDESDLVFPGFIDSLLDNAVGQPGYYGAFTANMHTDYNNCGTACPDGHASEVWAQQIIASAKARGVPVVSAKQMLQWLDGRNGSSFDLLSWSGNTLSFTVSAVAGANGLQAMLPIASASGGLASITRAGTPVPYSVQTIKGMDYAFFPATSGTFQATYGAPLITGVTAAPGSSSVTIAWTTDKNSTSRVEYGTSPTGLNLVATNSAIVTAHSILLTGLTTPATYYFRVTSSDGSGSSVTWPPAAASPATFTTIDPTPPSISELAATPGGTGMAAVTWTTNKLTTSRLDFGVSAGALNQSQSDSAMVSAHAIALTGLITGATYYYRVTSVDALGNTAIFPPLSDPPATFIQNSISIWTGAFTPTLIDSADPTAAELGMKFRSDVPGVVTGIRFYKAPANTGPHVGNLWSSTGALLASVAFENESAAGWQTATFATPVSINANTTYIISYFAPNGRYSVNAGFFNTGVDSPPIHANGIDGPNGVYSYSATSTFPTSTFNANNYWVDVVLRDNAPPPAISSVSVFQTSSTSAIVMWTTDKLASSVVSFGLSSGNLTLSAGTSAASTVHSVTITGLVTNTTYYYQVSSTDLLGRTTVAPSSAANFTVRPTVSDDTLADFNGGTGTCPPVTSGDSGAVILPAAVVADFNAAALPSGWLSNVWAVPGGVTLGGGSLAVDGAVAASGAAYNAGRSLEFRATFSGQALQHVGFAANLNFDAPWIIFSTGAGGNNLYARISGQPDVLLPGNWLGAPHQYRIDWTSANVIFSIDGVVVSTQSAAMTTDMVLIASDATPGGGNLSVNWMRLGPYATSCSFLSRVFDAGSTVGWSSMSWLTTLSPGTSVAMSYRTGNTPLPDASWTSLMAVGTPGGALTGSSRYLQYSAGLSTVDAARTPVLETVSIAYNNAVPPSITTQPASPTINNGQTATLTVVATGTPTLTYQWFSGTSGDTSQLIVAATAASYTTPVLTATKAYWVRVSNGAGSVNSATANVTVNRAPSSTILTASPNPSVSGQTVVLTARVTANATGVVTFLDGATALGTGTLSNGTATFSTSSLTAGSHSLTASYPGDTGFSASTSAAVTTTVTAAATTTALSSSATPAVYGQTVTLTATVNAVAPGAGPVQGTVTFKDGASVLGTATLASGSATLTLTTLTVGSHALTAAYGATSSYTASTSTVLTQTVNKASTTTTFTISPATSVVGQSVTLTATVAPVAPGGGTPTGTVSLLSGSTVLGTGTLTGGTVTQVVTTVPIGSYSFTVAYGADANFNGSSSTAVSAVVNQASTTTGLVAAPNPSLPGQTVVLTATVAVASPGAGTPTGSVTFRDGGTTLATVSLNNGAAALSLSSLALGSHSFTAIYGGSTDFKTSTSAAVAQAITQASTTTTLSTSPNPSLTGQSVTLTATVAVVAPGTGTPSGTITFRNGTTVLGTAALSSGRASISLTNLPLGAQSLTASYGGATNYATSTSAAVTQTVNTPSTATALTATPNPSTSGQTLTLRATVTVVSPGTGTPTGTVTFKDGTTTLGTATLSSGVGTMTISTLSLGAHSLTAVYGGASNFSGSTSSVLTQTVNPPPTNTVLTSNLNPSIYGQSTTLRAVVSPVSGTGSPTGTVTFRDGTTVIGTVTLSGGVAITAVSTLTGGSHALTAVYSGSTTFAGSTSSTVTQVVNKATTATNLNASASNSVYSQSVTLTATISSSLGGMTGTVTFRDGTTTIGTATVSAGAASLAVATLSPGSHQLTATYNGDTNFAADASSTFLESVSQAATTTAVVSTVNPARFGQSVSLVATVRPAASATATPGGSITFRDGSSTLATVNLSGGTATLTTAALSVGNHSITAVYNDDSNFTASTSSALTQVVNQTTTTTALTSSPNPSNLGQTVTLRATVAPVSPGGGTPTGTVLFKDGSTTIGTVSLSSGTATLNISSLSRTNHTITAQYQGTTSYAASTSPSVTQSVR